VFVDIAPVLRLIPLEVSIAHCIDIYMYKDYPKDKTDPGGLFMKANRASGVCLSE
jgi:hypothetical protein